VCVRVYVCVRVHAHACSLVCVRVRVRVRVFACARACTCIVNRPAATPLLGKLQFFAFFLELRSMLYFNIVVLYRKNACTHMIYGPTYIYMYVYIHIQVCVCVCVRERECVRAYCEFSRARARTHTLNNPSIEPYTHIHPTPPAPTLLHSSCHTLLFQIARKPAWISHDTHMNESWHTYE